MDYDKAASFWERKDSKKMDEAALKTAVDAVKKMDEPINLIKITPKEIDFLNSDFKKDGLDSRQHLIKEY